MVRAITVVGQAVNAGYVRKGAHRHQEIRSWARITWCLFQKMVHGASLEPLE